MTALILDDESLPAKHLEKMIQQYCFEITKIKVFQSASTVLNHLEENEYDIIFLDVEMPEMSGFDFIKYAHLPNSTQVIFTTAYSQYALDAFKANAAHYILKPVMEDELVKAVRKATQLINPNSKSEEKITADMVAIFDGKQYQVIHAEDIIRLEADGSYTKYVLANRKILSSKRLGAIEDTLPKKYFFRCHKSHIINLEHIKSISKTHATYLTLINDDIVPVSPSNRDNLNHLLLK